LPAKNIHQQRLFGMVHAYQKGELKHPSSRVKSVADHISPQDATDFAATSHADMLDKQAVMSDSPGLHTSVAARRKKAHPPEEALKTGAHIDMTQPLAQAPDYSAVTGIFGGPDLLAGHGPGYTMPTPDLASGISPVPSQELGRVAPPPHQGLFDQAKNWLGKPGNAALAGAGVGGLGLLAYLAARRKKQHKQGHDKHAAFTNIPPGGKPPVSPMPHIGPTPAAASMSAAPVPKTTKAANVWSALGRKAAAAGVAAGPAGPSAGMIGRTGCSPDINQRFTFNGSPNTGMNTLSTALGY
jgi:hypothetical protein